MNLADLKPLADQFGIHFPDEIKGYIEERYARDWRLAMDAQPSLITQSNAGIPAYLTNYVEPKLIEVLLAPNKAAEILGEAKKGDWTSQQAYFPIVEYTGEVSSYGDWNENGSASANANFPQRQAYHYQTMTQWGERQLDLMGLARIDYASRVNIASAIVLNKFQNTSYFLGVAGLQNYGLLNDPNLSAPIAPSVKTAGGVAWITNGVVTATGAEVYLDIQSMFQRLVAQANGLVDQNTKMILAMSPTSSVALTATNQYNVNVTDQLKKNFPNLRVETAVQYATDSGELVQLIAEEIEGQETGVCAFTEKMRAHAIERKTSSFLQKKSQGTWGAVIWQPFAISQMLGV